MTSVSAIITTHNRLSDLKNAIESVRAQTYSIVECIVVDDASVDDTQEWMTANRNNWLKYLRIAKADSRGGNHARNLGFQSSHSDYVAYLDDDDIWLPEKIEKQVAVAENNSDCGVVYCGRIYKTGENEETIIIPDAIYTGWINEKIYTRIISTTSTFMIKRTTLEQISGFDENLEFWQETEMMMRLCQVAKVYYVLEPLVIYYAIPSQNRLSTKYYNWLHAVNYIRKKHKEQIEMLSAEDKTKFELMYYEDGVNRCNNNELKKERKTHLKEIAILEPSLKNHILYFCNMSNITKARIKKVKDNLFRKGSR